MRIIFELAKYTMLVIMLVYSIVNILGIIHWEDPEAQNRRGRSLSLLSVTAMACGYLVLTQTVTDAAQSLTLAAFGFGQIVLFRIYYLLFCLIYKNGSRIIANNVIFLASLGLLLQARLDTKYAMRQLVFLGIGMIFTLVLPALIEHMSILGKYKTLGYFYGILGILLLVAVRFAGKTTLGAQLSITVGGIAIQPSEFVKISFVFMTAVLLKEDNSFKNVCATTILAASHVGILAWSTDLGSALVFFMAYLAMLFIATRKAVYPLLGLLCGALAAVAMYYIFAHVRIRVAIWQDPFLDYDTRGYQLAQGLFGLSTGGWSGLGLGQGLASTIPLARNDMIFDVICEELGVIFAILLIVIYMLFTLQMCMVSIKVNRQYLKIIGVGAAITLGFQTLLHIGGTTKMIPLTGITLPLISYGGSSVFSTMIFIGIIQGLYLTKAKEEAEVERRRKESEKRQKAVRGY